MNSVDYAHDKCPGSATGRTIFRVLSGNAPKCPACGAYLEVKPMTFEGSTGKPNDRGWFSHFRGRNRERV